MAAYSDLLTEGLSTDAEDYPSVLKKKKLKDSLLTEDAPPAPQEQPAPPPPAQAEQPAPEAPAQAAPQQRQQQSNPFEQKMMDSLDRYDSEMSKLRQKQQAEHDQRIAAMHKRPGLKDLLLNAAVGFAAGAGTPNIAHGGGTDVMRGAMNGFQTVTGINDNRAKMAQERELHEAQINEKQAQALKEQYSPEMARQALMMRPYLSQQKIDSTEGIADKKNATNIQIAGQRDSTNRAKLDETKNNDNWKQRFNVTTGNRQLAQNGFQPLLTRDAVANGTAPTPTPEQDPAKLSIPLQDKHTNAGLTAKYLDAKTGEVRERASMMPDILNIRKQLAQAAMIRASNSTQMAQIAKDVFNWNYKGIDSDKNPIFDTEDGRIVIPKVEAMNKVPAAMQTKTAMADGVSKTVDDITAKVNQLRNEGVIGPGMGRLESLGIAIGLRNPEVRALKTTLDNLAQLQVPLHGARGARMQEIIKASVGGIEQDPDNLLAALAEAKTMAGRLGTANRTIYKPVNRKPNTGNPNQNAGGGDMVTVYFKSSKTGAWTPRQIPSAQKAAAIASGSYKEKPE